MALNQVGLERLDLHQLTNKIGENKNLIINGQFELFGKGELIVVLIQLMVF